MKRYILASTLILLAPAAFACETVTVGGMSLRNAWSKATIGASRPASFYVEIANNGASDDALIAIMTPAADKPMLHQTVIQDGLATMPHVEAVDVPAGETVSLSPGGYHGMLMELTTALSEGQTFPVTLTFEQAGAIEIDTQVLPMRAQEAQCDAAN